VAGAFRSNDGAYLDVSPYEAAGASGPTSYAAEHRDADYHVEQAAGPAPTLHAPQRPFLRNLAQTSSARWRRNRGLGTLRNDNREQVPNTAQTPAGAMEPVHQQRVSFRAQPGTWDDRIAPQGSGR
jgi:hypothetical protein